MIVVDTSAWIEWLKATPAGHKIKPLLPADEDWILPTIVQLELAKWAKRELGETKAAQVLSMADQFFVVPLTTELALKAAKLSVDLKLATADAIIYATSETYSAKLLTCDAHFASLPNAIWVEKTT
jgi:uncharacterized protein